MKLSVTLLLIMLMSSTLSAEETSYPILYPMEGGLRLRECTTDADCSFSGTQVLSGEYSFGFNAICDTGEEDGCVSLDFYPNDAAVLPQFKGWRLKSISIMNYKEAAQKLLGKALAAKIISSTKIMLQAHMPGKDFGAVTTAKGTAIVVIGNYVMGISCDAPYANAELLGVKMKGKPRLETSAK